MIDKGIGFVCHPTKYEHPYGDVIYDAGGLGRFLREFHVEEIVNKNVLLLGYLSPNHWNALQHLGYFGEEHLAALHRRSLYTCPYTKQKYTSLIPLAIFDNNIEQYFSAFGNNLPYYHEMACDKSWNLSGDDPYSTYETVEDQMSNMCIVMQGTGYTHSCIQSDGSWSRVPVIVDIDNSSGLLYCSQLVWHNK